MKTHKRFKTNLFVGLLSLHALCSCSYTGQKLGLGNNKEVTIEMNHQETSSEDGDADSIQTYTGEDPRKAFKRVNNEYNLNNRGTFYYMNPLNWRNPFYYLKQYATLFIICTTASLVVIGGTTYALLPPQPSNNLDTLPTLIPLNVTEKPARHTPELITQNPAGLVTNQILSDSIERDLLEHNCSKARLKYWIEGKRGKKLDVNAKRKGKGMSLLTLVISINEDENAWNYLKKKGAHLDGQDSIGETTLMKMADRANLRACRWLIENGANTCLKNYDNESVKYYINNGFSNPKQHSERDFLLGLLNKQCQ